uniref:Ribosomal protein S10 n=1 Tax=Romanomermis culicivorax TaxID=13658 RepID=A0A915HIJ4_ROMCU
MILKEFSLNLIKRNTGSGSCMFKTSKRRPHLFKAKCKALFKYLPLGSPPFGNKWKKFNVLRSDQRWSERRHHFRQTSPDLWTSLVIDVQKSRELTFHFNIILVGTEFTDQMFNRLSHVRRPITEISPSKSRNDVVVTIILKNMEKNQLI